MSNSPENVVTSTDVAPKSPTSFRDLKKAQLVEAATYFGTDDEGGVETLRAGLVENGVTWDMYVKAFKLEGHEDLPEPVERTFRQVEIEDDPEEEVVKVTEEVVTVEEKPVLAPQDKYLIKMTRKNPYFEFRHYRFTQEKPYAIMKADDAQAILESEKGFRQAFPAELREFYS